MSMVSVMCNRHDNKENKIKTNIIEIVATTRLWNNLHQV